MTELAETISADHAVSDPWAEGFSGMLLQAADAAEISDALVRMWCRACPRRS
jgi:hypothetical protein